MQDFIEDKYKLIILIDLGFFSIFYKLFINLIFFFFIDTCVAIPAFGSSISSSFYTDIEPLWSQQLK